jgi:hypothetical protein
VEKELVIINGFLGTNFTKMEDALLVIETLKTSNVLKYEQLQLLLLKEDEKDKKPTLPESVKVNQAKWSKSLKNSSFKKGFLTLTGIAKELEGLENFSQFNVSGTEVRVHDGNTIDTKVDSYLPICFIYDGKLVKCKIPVSKLASVEQEVLNGLPFQFSLCEFVETIIEGSEVAYIKYAFGPI